jgi:tRNA-intron lyase
MLLGQVIGEQIIVKDCSLFNFGQVGKGTLSKTKPVGGKKQYIRPFKKKKVEISSFSTTNTIIFSLIHGIWTRYYKFLTTCCKNIQMVENLILSPQEALYLHQFRVIDVHYKDEILSDSDLWNLFCTFQGFDYFVSRYVCYVYYKQQGWIVKSGIKYGCDYVLYDKEIEKTHAEFCVLITQSDLSTLEISRQVRLTTTIAKTLKLCRIYYPKDVDLESLGKCQVWDVDVRRREFET